MIRASTHFSTALFRVNWRIMSKILFGRAPCTSGSACQGSRRCLWTEAWGSSSEAELRWCGRLLNDEARAVVSSSVHSPEPYMLIQGDLGNGIPPKAAPYQKSKPSGSPPFHISLLSSWTITMLHHSHSDSFSSKWRSYWGNSNVATTFLTLDGVPVVIPSGKSIFFKFLNINHLRSCIFCICI